MHDVNCGALHGSAPRKNSEAGSQGYLGQGSVASSSRSPTCSVAAHRLLTGSGTKLGTKNPLSVPETAGIAPYAVLASHCINSPEVLIFRGLRGRRRLGSSKQNVLTSRSFVLGSSPGTPALADRYSPGSPGLFSLVGPLCMGVVPSECFTHLASQHRWCHWLSSRNLPCQPNICRLSVYKYRSQADAERSRLTPSTPQLTARYSTPIAHELRVIPTSMPA